MLKAVRPDLELVGLDVVGSRLDRLPLGVYASSVEANATSLPFDDDSLDAVLAGEFVEHLTSPDAHAVLDEVRRVLREGGRLLLTTPNPNGFNVRLRRGSVLGGAHLSQYPPRELRTLLRRHRLVHVRLIGSGRMTRWVGEHARPLSLYGSCLAVADKAHPLVTFPTSPVS